VTSRGRVIARIAPERDPAEKARQWLLHLRGTASLGNASNPFPMSHGVAMWSISASSMPRQLAPDHSRRKAARFAETQRPLVVHYNKYSPAFAQAAAWGLPIEVGFCGESRQRQSARSNNPLKDAGGFRGSRPPAVGTHARTCGAISAGIKWQTSLSTGQVKVNSMVFTYRAKRPSRMLW
jgi:hypothetical protein